MSESHTPTPDSPTPAPKTKEVGGAKEVLYLLVLAAGFGGALRTWIAAVIIVTAILVMFDARSAGIRKEEGKKGLLNMDPFGWGAVTLFLFVVGYPLYLVRRMGSAGKKGNPVLLALVCVGGVVVVLGLVFGIGRALLFPPVKAQVVCKGAAKRFA